MSLESHPGHPTGAATPAGARTRARPGRHPLDRRFSLAPLVPWRTLPRPIPWDRVFGRTAPIQVELGFGLGDYLIRTAAARPDRNFVGVEIAWFLVRRTLQKLARAGLTNVALIHANAGVALGRLFTEASIHRAWALFPCPWPKTHHVRKRLFSRSFILLLNSRLVQGGEAFVVTDDPDHARWIDEQGLETGFRMEREIIPPQFATRYEKEWEGKGHDRFYKTSFTKQTHIAIPIKEETALQTRIAPSFCMTDLKLSPMKGRATIVPKDTLYDPGQERAMVRVLVVETDLTQDIWIDIVRQPSGWHIRPAKGCGMIPTSGVQEALDLFYREIVGSNHEQAATPGHAT
jgi:tRNA (guanine-N7-)-methyltransferase